MAKKKPEVEEFMEIGGSPMPGITLRQVLRGHTAEINRIAWSPDGRYLASPSEDATIRIWDIAYGECVAELKGHEGAVYSVAWSPNSKTLASGGEDGFVRLWQTNSDQEIRSKIKIKETQKFKGNGEVVSVCWSPDGTCFASIDNINGKIKIRKLPDYDTNPFYKTVYVSSQIAWSPDGKWIGLATKHAVTVLDSETGQTNKDFPNLSVDAFNMDKKDSESEEYYDGMTIVWSSNSKFFVTGGRDKRIRVVNIGSSQNTRLLEGHTGTVRALSLTFDNSLLASKADDGIFIWKADTWNIIAIIGESISSSNNSRSSNPTLAFHPRKYQLATLSNKDTVIRIWDINFDALINNKSTIESVHYTTAKLVLVGDSGVGKTGLGWRLAHNEFKEHSSTHGQQFWVVPELKKTREDGTECEAVLWDLAGQPDYRLVHSLYLDDVDTAMVLFDPSNRQEPLAGVDFWLNQLKDKDKKLRNAILVGARTDRGTSTLTDAELQAFCERNGISGGYIPTSAIKGEGLFELIERLKAQIPWDEMTTTVTTVTFKRIKEFVLALKEKTERKNVLVKPEELREQLQATDKDWEFSDAEMMTAVGHLGTHGYVKVIHNSNGEHSILLAPDIMANLASSIVLEARRNPRGLGVLEEERLLRGEYPFAELNNLSDDERKILLDAVAVLFLERNLCFRETFNQQTFLVFPSLINEKRPVDETIKIEEGASYRVKGAVENIYASLVVLLGYTNTFTRTHQWQNQAQYEMGEGEICGFQQSEYRNGEIELVLYYDQKTPDPVRLTFRGLFERFLSRRELDISRYQPVICHKCGSPLARNVIMDQLSKSKDFSFCHECGERLQLPDPEPVSRLSRREEVIIDVQQAIAQRRTAFEAALVRVKGLLRDQSKEKIPACFISYAWGTSEHQRWVMQLAKDLRNSGIDVLLDRWNIVPGANLDRYIERIMETDFVVVVGTSGLLQKYNSKTSDPVVTAELEMLNLRLRQPNKYGHTILPILVEGESDSAFSPQLQKLVYIDFKQSAFYFRQLFDMIWRLYDLPFDNPLLEELQVSMTPQQM